MSDTLTGQVKKSWKFLLVLAIVGGLFGAFPHIAARVVAGVDWQGVAPELTGDGLFYMTRASKAIHGEITGNPYYVTPYNNPSPSFSAIDLVQGIPYAFLSPFWAATLNTFLWNGMFALMLGILLLRLGFSRRMIIFSWLIIALSMFKYMLRVGHTQIMFPYFLLFFILLLETWRKDRLGVAGKYDPVWLGLCAGLTTYLYTFLFQVVVVSLAVGVAAAFILRRKKLVRFFIVAIGTMVAVAIPYLFYLHGVTTFPAFGETMNLFAGVRSHFPSPQVYFYGRWLLLLVAWALLLWLMEVRMARKKTEVVSGETETPSLEDTVLTMAMVSLGTFGVMLENVIIGVDISGPPHANFFVLLLVPLGLVLFTGRSVRGLFEKGFYVQKVLLLICILIVAREVWSTLPPQFPEPYLQSSFYRPDSESPIVKKPAGNPQYIMPVLEAIRSLPGAQVIAAPEPLNAYIPLYTGQHLLFIPDGGLFSTTHTNESVDRLFTSKLGQILTREEVARAYDWVEAPNNELVGRDKLARKLCTMILRSPACSTLVVAHPYRGDGVINESAWFEYYQTKVRPNVLKYLHRFNVSQVVIDRRLSIPEILRGQTPWHQDQYYAIYDITSLYTQK